MVSSPDDIEKSEDKEQEMVEDSDVLIDTFSNTSSDPTSETEGKTNKQETTGANVSSSAPTSDKAKKQTSTSMDTDDSKGCAGGSSSIIHIKNRLLRMVASQTVMFTLGPEVSKNGRVELNLRRRDIFMGALIVVGCLIAFLVGCVQKSEQVNTVFKTGTRQPDMTCVGQAGPSVAFDPRWYEPPSDKKGVYSLSNLPCWPLQAYPDFIANIELFGKSFNQVVGWLKHDPLIDWLNNNDPPTISINNTGYKGVLYLQPGLFRFRDGLTSVRKSGSFHVAYNISELIIYAPFTDTSTSDRGFHNMVQWIFEDVVREFEQGIDVVKVGSGPTADDLFRFAIQAPGGPTSDEYWYDPISQDEYASADIVLKDGTSFTMQDLFCLTRHDHIQEILMGRNDWLCFDEKKNSIGTILAQGFALASGTLGIASIVTNMLLGRRAL